MYIYIYFVSNLALWLQQTNKLYLLTYLLTYLLCRPRGAMRVWPNFKFMEVPTPTCFYRTAEICSSELTIFCVPNCTLIGASHRPTKTTNFTAFWSWTFCDGIIWRCRVAEKMLNAHTLLYKLLLRSIIKTLFGRPFVKQFALCHRSVVCPVCL